MEEVLSVEIRSQITTEELKEYAAKATRSIVIRHAVNGNSDDRRRDTTLENTYDTIYIPIKEWVRLQPQNASD